MSGERIYFPNSTQFKRMNESLKAIAGIVNRNIDISTWAGIQNAVRSGIAKTILPIGTQLTIEHDMYGVCVLDVVAHDYFKSAIDENAHTMTLMSHDVLTRMQFDNPEAFYYAESELPAGTYNFTIPTTYGSWNAGTYQFTLPYSLPKGGQLGISENSTVPVTSARVVAYVTNTYDFSQQTAEITTGSSGTSLGTFGMELNHTHRVSYGNNNYKESAIRQFLNSSNTMGYVWTPQTKYDRPPNWLTSLDGFMAGLRDEFLSVVGTVVVPCSANKIYESPDSTIKTYEQYNLVDKFYIASQTEIFGDNPSGEDGSTLLQFYDGSVDAERVKYDSGGVARRCWTRSPLSTNTASLHTVGSAGDRTYTATHDNCGVAPMCTIV